MFSKLNEVLASCQSISLIVSSDGEKMTVTVIPKPKNETEAALKTPLNLVGTPAELDEGFIAALSTYATAHKSLSDQVEETAKLLETAKKQSTAKAVKQAAKSEPKPTSLDELTPEPAQSPQAPSSENPDQKDQAKPAPENTGGGLDIASLL